MAKSACLCYDIGIKTDNMGESMAESTQDIDKGIEALKQVEQTQINEQIEEIETNIMMQATSEFWKDWKLFV